MRCPDVLHVLAPARGDLVDGQSLAVVQAQDVGLTRSEQAVQHTPQEGEPVGPVKCIGHHLFDVGLLAEVGDAFGERQGSSRG